MSNEEIDRILEDVEELLRAAREQPAEWPGMNAESPVPAVHPWSDESREERYADRAARHGFPPGLAKSARNLRDTLRSYEQVRNQAMPGDDRVDQEAVHEALAWALDAERFLGSLSGPGGEGVRAGHIDDIAANLLAWLRYKGYALTPLQPRPAEEADSGASAV